MSNMIRTAAIGSVTALALAAAGTASAIEFKAGDTTVNVYGYAKLDAIYDVDAALGTFGINSNVDLNREENTRNGNFDLQAVESRLGVSTSTGTSMGNVTTLIEGDFLGVISGAGTDGRGGFRVRRAFGTWNGILAGQEWSNFTSFVGVTPTLDFFGQVGSGHITRQAQVRYTSGPLSVALEDPTTIGGTVGPDSQNRLPDLTVRLEDKAGNMTYSFAGLARQLRFNDGEQSDSEFGYGVSFQAKLQLAPGISVQGGASYGDGIAGYIKQAPAAPGYVDANGNVETIKVAHGSVGISIATGPGAINLSYSIADADVDDLVADTAATALGTNEQFESTHLNYIWSPVRNVTYGIEASYHTRTVQSGASGDALRLQGMARYSF